LRFNAQEETMKRLLSKNTALLAVTLILALAGFAGASEAQQSAPLRVRGTITQIKGDDLTVKSADGKILTITLAPDATVTAIVPAKLSDIKPGRFVGTAARPAGDKWEALEVHIFPPGSRQGEGHRPFAPEPGATMTNAEVTAAVVHAKHGELTLATGGQSFTIVVPRGVPVVAMNPGTRALVKKGAWVYFTQVTADSNGALSAKSIGVSKDRRYPPK
jgi:hypothetical protein